MGPSSKTGSHIPLPLWKEWLTDTRENITIPQLLLGAVVRFNSEQLFRTDKLDME